MTASQIKRDPFSIRLTAQMLERINGAIGATYNDYNRTEIIVRALDLYFCLLDHNPSLLPGYDPEQDKSVTRNKSL